MNTHSLLQALGVAVEALSGDGSTQYMPDVQPYEAAIYIFDALDKAGFDIVARPEPQPPVRLGPREPDLELERMLLIQEAAASVSLDGDTYSLPPLEPKQTKPLTVSQVSCPRCGAKKGKPCFGMTHAGTGGVVDTTTTIQTHHTARRDRAKQLSS